VPPTDRLPMQMTGKPNEVERKIPLSYSQLRIPIIIQYNKAKGNNKMRKDLRKKLENIHVVGCDTNV